MNGERVFLVYNANACCVFWIFADSGESHSASSIEESVVAARGAKIFPEEKVFLAASRSKGC
jgi:hypothetical protein